MVGGDLGHHRAAALLGGARSRPCSQRSWREPCSAGRAAASVRTVTTGQISATPSSVAFWSASSMRSPLRGGQGQHAAGAATRAAAATAPSEARRDAFARDQLEHGLELGPGAVEDADLGARPQAQHLARVVGGVLGQVERAPPGAASGTWKRWRVTGDPAEAGQALPAASTTSAAHSPSRCSRGGPHAANASRTAGTSSSSRPERTSADRAVRRSAWISAARSTSSGAMQVGEHEVEGARPEAGAAVRAHDVHATLR